jgi:nucleotide-binding universal stress UspA family protein
MAIKKILVPIDFSPTMDCVLRIARELAGTLEAELHLLHVREIVAMPVYPAATIGYPGIGMPEMGMAGGIPMAATAGGFGFVDVPNKSGKSRLRALQEELASSGLKVAAHQPEGAVVSEILQAADKISADLIVMGSHGHGSVYNLLVGSVTEGVLKAGKRPVLLVPAPAATK